MSFRFILVCTIIFKMQKIVEKGLKIDLHIHSSASKAKDGALVCDGTTDNLHELIERLVSNEVDVFSITDHDCFSQPIYQAAKKFEIEGKVKKVLPGVEFSVGMVDDDKKEKLIHVIAIFDDSSDSGIDRLAKALPVDAIPYDDVTNERFSSEGLCNVLDKIGLNAVLIAHQKNSENSAHPQAQDLSSLGQDRFRELINIEYFDSLEYKSEKRAIYHTLFKKEWNEEDYERVRFITGSDCHQWSAYPKRSSDSTDSDMQYTYIKSLPTFKGLVMAITDDSRIGKSANFYSSIKKFQKSIDLEIDGKDVSIPLSPGVNAIIGDNSIGKSMILHAMTNYCNLDNTHNIPDTRKKDYEKCLSENHMKVKTLIDSEDFSFDSQGDIRFHFENKNFATTFLHGKGPEPTPSTEYVNFINNNLEGFYTSLQTKFEFDDILAKLQSLTICEAPSNYQICSASKCQQNYIDGYKTKNLKRIISSFKTLVDTTGTLITLLTDESDKKALSDYLVSLKSLQTKYTDRQSKEERLTNILVAINAGIDGYNALEDGLQTTAEKDYQSFQDTEGKLISDIARLCLLKSNIGKYDFSIETPYPISFSHNDYGDISLTARFVCKITQIDNNYLHSLIMSVLQKGSDFPDTSVIKEKELTDKIKDANQENGKSGLALLKAKVTKQIQADFQTEEQICKNGSDCTQDYSSGFNASEYFHILSSDDNGKIYIVDQPEDDVSQPGIAHEVVPDLRRMRKKHQIILVTHNPQFVMNLDADNVIFLSKKDQHFLIQSGALEYEDKDYDILKIIEDNLDGGEESIKKRWKRYDKNNQNSSR